MRLIKRAVHIDFHTMADIPDFGEHFDAAQFARTLKEARVDFINAFAKCNIGFAYYPTEVGVVHPHLKFDMLGQTIEECRKLGIGVTAYFNVGLDHEMARKHRDWCVLNKDGQVIYGDRTANFFRNMCFRSGYRDYMLAMIQEVVDRYPIDGVFLDCIVPRACYGDECCEGMHAIGLDPLNDDHVLEHAKEGVYDFCRDVKSIVGDEKFLYLNGLEFGESEGMNTHAEIECLPGAWSYDFFPARAAYARNLGFQVFYMTGRFQENWGDFGGLKSKASLENDCWDAISNAVNTSVGDHMHPRDGLDPAVYRMIGEVYTELEKLEPWTEYARAVADIGVVVTTSGIIGDWHNGAVRMLGELDYTYDLIDERMDFAKYQVIVLPDNIAVTPLLQTKLEAHLALGRGVVSTGGSGLNPEKSGFAIDAWNMEYEGPDPWNSSYFKMLEPMDGAVPDMLCGQYSQNILLQVKEGAQSVADYYQPYFNRKWDGFHGSFYTPPEKYAGRPAVARSGNIFQFCFNVFTAYFNHALPAHKGMIDYAIKQLLAAPLLKCEGIPSTARVTVTEKDEMRMIHIKSTCPEPRGRYNVVEDRPILRDVAVSVRSGKPNRVYAAPSKEPLAFEQSEEGYVRISVPHVDGYLMIVME